MAKSKTLSRRDFLVRTATLAGVATVGAGLAACAPAGPASTDAGDEAPAMEVITITMWKGPHKAAGDENETLRPTHPGCS